MISVGIDVSKGKSTVCILKPGGEVLKTPFDVLHTIEDMLSLVNLIKTYDDEVRVILEDTGHYHWPVVTTLVEKGIFVCCINALRMKKYCAQSIRKTKTDKIDSIRIASYGITYWCELIPVLTPGETYRELKLLARQYYQVTSLLIKAKVNLSNLLDQTMPEIQSVLNNSPSNNKLTEFVKRYWHYSHILNMGKSRFITDYCKWAKKQGYRSNERKAEVIFALSQNGIPVLPNSQSTKIVVTETVRMLHEIELSRNTILTQMQQLAKSLPEYSIITAMSGIGPVLAPRIIAEIGDVRRFSSKRALIAYAGIDSPPFQSGAFFGTERHITKRGNSYLRKTGFEIMQSLIQLKPEHNEVFAFIQKKRLEGKPAKVAMIAGLNKFLRIYYGRISETYSAIDEQLIYGSQF